MKSDNALKQYMENNILTATPEKLILMLYNGCIKNLNFAKQSIEEKSIEKTNTYLKKAQDIVFELQASLDYKYNIAKEMNNMYNYILEVLIDANIEKNAEKVDIALKFIIEFRDTWAEAMKLSKGDQAIEKVG